MGLKTLIIFGSLVLTLSTVSAGDNSNETEAEMFLQEYNDRAQTVYPESIEISWTYNTDITEENQQAMVRNRGWDDRNHIYPWYRTFSV